MGSMGTPHPVQPRDGFPFRQGGRLGGLAILEAYGDIAAIQGIEDILADIGATIAEGEIPQIVHGPAIAGLQVSHFHRYGLHVLRHLDEQHSVAIGITFDQGVGIGVEPGVGQFAAGRARGRIIVGDGLSGGRQHTVELLQHQVDAVRGHDATVILDHLVVDAQRQGVQRFPGEAKVDDGRFLHIEVGIGRIAGFHPQQGYPGDGIGAVPLGAAAGQAQLADLGGSRRQETFTEGWRSPSLSNCG